MHQVIGSIISNRRILRYGGTEYLLLKVSAPLIASECKPGQFLMLKCGDDAILRRPISIHSANSDTGEIELLFSVSICATNERDFLPILRVERLSSAGKGTRWLRSQKSGVPIELLGPLGHGFNIDKHSQNILIVAGGIGIAPMRFLAEECVKLGRTCTVLIGAVTAAGIYPPVRLPAGAQLVVTTEDGSLGSKGLVTQLLLNYLKSTNTKSIDQVFACGPKAMYMEIARQQRHYRWPQEIQVSLELRMGCGFGACYGCSIKTRRGLKKVCRDGPVFNIKDIIWQEVNL